MGLIELPIVMIEHIFSYLSYDEIAKNRLVSRSFNEISSRLLNRGFMMIERRHAMSLKSVKTQLPRRESERRYHPLSRHCDILTSIETRISMLNMTYSKFIDQGFCCFIPGKVIDEIKRVLTIVETSTTPPRAHEVLQELRDISSMAIEHFDDKISPAFRKSMHQGITPPAPRPQQAVLSPVALRQEMLHLRRRSFLNAKLSLYLATQYKKFFKRMMDYKKMAWRQKKVIRELRRKQKDQDNSIADLKKRIEECDIKYSELTHTNQAVGGKANVSTAGEVATTSGQPLRHFSSQIKLDLSVLPIGTSKRNGKLKVSNMKPRKPLIKLPSLSEDDSAPPAKIQKKDDPRPSPSPPTSHSPRPSPLPPTSHSPRTRSQSTLAKIRGITNEIRQLSTLSNTYELKRPLALSTSGLHAPDSKKQKLD